MTAAFYQALPWILGVAGLILAGELVIFFRRRRAQRRRLQARIDAIFSHNLKPPEQP
jgi:hypothetical protein